MPELFSKKIMTLISSITKISRLDERSINILTNSSFFPKVILVGDKLFTPTSDTNSDDWTSLANDHFTFILPSFHSPKNHDY